jgi:malate dehydrogenase (oxaloacetate-decarboxylating)(NADP+)
VLIFPDLASGNIAYKLLVECTNAEALGALIVGIGATESEIVDITTYTVVRALDQQRARRGLDQTEGFV